MGPAELLVLTFPQQTITIEAAEALAKLRTGGDVRVIDSLVVTRHPEGEATYGELADFEHLRGVVPDGSAELPLIGPEDAQEAAELLAPGTVALLVLIEHVWAQETAEALREIGGRIASGVRIPPENIGEAVRAAEAHRAAGK
ncbi:DUF6325 family protein [Streptomyces sp. CB01881]|uniref:DUF6325 family protein n=1 Tax=Streptomyces sp. CB01881 TaxID=2078691 RepID=UPI000CDC3C2E|nr:DUF6325 family protein [Streptomyces sp. CB01881]AUY48744.1 hypothetical protein C2142_07085 [Streptomyces sp. CB01881]TYC77234.1 hypothetical protein EH183_07090 [Streptomyces sp. CB01881]